MFYINADVDWLAAFSFVFLFDIVPFRCGSKVQSSTELGFLLGCVRKKVKRKKKEMRESYLLKSFVAQ